MMYLCGLELEIAKITNFINLLIVNWLTLFSSDDFTSFKTFRVFGLAIIKLFYKYGKDSPV